VSARPIRAVISDFGGVLTTPLHAALGAYSDASGITAREIGLAMERLFERDGRHPLFELEKGRTSYGDFIRVLEAELGEGADLIHFGEALMSGLHPNEPMVALMRDLRSRGLRMALLTNNVREWEPLWRAKLPDVDAIFDVIVDSAFVGMRKPEHEIYEETVRRLDEGIEAGECLFLDDLEINCDGAREAGMHAVRFVDNEQAIGEVEAALDESGT
jgi:putative hydrolase of the HAD superfamily